MEVDKIDSPSWTSQPILPILAFFVVSSFVAIAIFGIPYWLYLWEYHSRKKTSKGEFENDEFDSYIGQNQQVLFSISSTIPYKTNEPTCKTYNYCSKGDDLTGRDADVDLENWEWVILGASFILQAICQGIAFSVGAFYSEWLDAFKDTKAMTAWVGSLNIGIMYCASPLASILVTVTSYRFVVTLGSLLACIGIFSGAFAESLITLYLTYGVIGGTGLGFMFTPSVGIVAVYFKKRRRLVLAFSVVGAGLGILLGPHLVTYWTHLYGWQGCLMMTAGVALLGCVYAFMLRPYRFWLRPRTNHHKLSGKNISISEIFGMYLWKDIRLWIYIFSTFLIAFGSFTMKIHVIEYAKSAGIRDIFNPWYISVSGVTYVLGIAIIGIISHLICLNVLKIYIIATVLTGLTMFLYTLYQSFEVFLVYGLIFGMLVGVMAGISPSVTIDMFGVFCVTNAIGYKKLGSGIGALLGPPFAGWLCDVTGGYEAPFIFSGVLIIFAGFVLLSIPNELFSLQKYAHVSKEDEHLKAMQRGTLAVRPPVTTLIVLRHDVSIVRYRVAAKHSDKMPPIIRSVYV